jgi:alkylation response protein AidB-like acyl-CoA dehydrogenase
MSADSVPPLHEYLAAAEAWLLNITQRRPQRGELSWGEGSDRVSLFRDSTPAEDRASLDAARAWQRLKFDAGYGAIGWPAEYGGGGLPAAYQAAFSRLEKSFDTPAPVEVFTISLDIEAPTILTLGSAEQKQRWVRSLRRCDEICCQLWSEPGAGSDLGSISTSAVRDGDDWVIDGQKVWTTGAQFADVGYLICRTDTMAPRQQAFTAFLVPMDAPGVEVRPLRQMTGGASFNEVFFTGVRVPEAARLGAVGAGWQAMMTTLGFERATAGSSSQGRGDVLGRIVMTARHYGRLSDPLVRQAIAHLHATKQMRKLTEQRAAARMRAGGVPGSEGSISKISMTRWLQDAGDVMTTILGPALIADTGEWGTFAWAEQILGTPGARLGGGTDEIQKNVIAERALGLPREPRVPATGHQPETGKEGSR